MDTNLIPIPIGDLPRVKQLDDESLLVLQHGGETMNMTAKQLREFSKGDKGDQGQPGEPGPAGKDATINGQNAAIIEAGNNIIIDQHDSALKISANVVNKNLLINHYFVNPVNRNGKREYTESGYTIDMWAAYPITGENTVKLSNDGITIGSDVYFSQRFERDLSGLTLTLSILFADNTLWSATGVFPKDPNSMVLHNEAPFLAYLEHGADGTQALLFKSFTDTTNTLVAMKLELGSVQTLAHQENGQWALNEIPNYAEQYAICEQYSPITGEFVGSQHSNEQLLVNARWDVKANIINQLGKEEYTGTGYTIDMWLATGNGTVWLTDGTLKIKRNSDTFYFAERDINQYLINSEYTFSVLVNDDIYTIIFNPSSQNYILHNTDFGSLYYEKGVGNGQVVIAITTEGELNLVAAKLELGPVQTLAHKEGDKWVLNDPPPNYQQELAKCQRYQMVLKNTMTPFLPVGTFAMRGDGGLTTLIIPISTTMRTETPTVLIDHIRLVCANKNDVITLTDPTITQTLMSSNCLFVQLAVDGLTGGDFGWIDVSYEPSARFIIDNNL